MVLMVTRFPDYGYLAIIEQVTIHAIMINESCSWHTANLISIHVCYSQNDALFDGSLIFGSVNINEYVFIHFHWSLISF